MAQLADDFKKMSSDDTQYLRMALSVVGMSNAAAQVVLTAWTSYQSAVREVNTFFDEKKLFDEMKEFFTADGAILSGANTDALLQKLNENDAESQSKINSALDKLCSYIPSNPFSQTEMDVTPVVEAAAEKVLDEADAKLQASQDLKEKLSAAHQQFQHLAEHYSDADAIQRRADAILTDGYVMEMSLAGLVVSFITLAVTYKSYKRQLDEMEEIKVELENVKTDYIDPIVNSFEETRRVNFMKLAMAKTKLQEMSARIARRMQEAKDNRNGMIMTGALSALNAATSIYRLVRVGRFASGQIQVLQAGLAAGQTFVAGGCGVLAFKIHGTLDEWKQLKEKVDARLAEVEKIYEVIEVSARAA